MATYIYSHISPVCHGGNGGVVVCVVSILCVNCYSVNLGMAVQNVFASAKMIAVLIVIAGGAWKLCQGNVQHLQNAFTNPTPPLGAMAAAFYTGLWAYDGWNNLNYVTEEIKNPSKYGRKYEIRKEGGDKFTILFRCFFLGTFPDRSWWASRW